VITEEFAGSFRLYDEVDKRDLFCGVRMWIEPGECGISMNDGKGGPAESIVFSDPISRWAISQLFALIHRKARTRRREYVTLAWHQPRQLPATTERAI
jgi:hypothetical protein